MPCVQIESCTITLPIVQGAAQHDGNKGRRSLGTSNALRAADFAKEAPVKSVDISTIIGRLAATGSVLATLLTATGCFSTMTVPVSELEHVDASGEVTTSDGTVKVADVSTIEPVPPDGQIYE